MALGWFRKKEEKTPPAAQPQAPAAPPPSPPVPLAKNVSISRLLDETLIVPVPSGLTKEQLIEFLVTRLCERRGLGDPRPFLDKVLEREQGISTTLDTGLAVPHARMDNLKAIAAVLGLVPDGMPDPKQPDLVIRAMFLFFSPNRQEAFTQHLHLLRGVSALFQPAFIDELLKAASPAAALKLVAAREGLA